MGIKEFSYSELAAQYTWGVDITESELMNSLLASSINY